MLKNEKADALREASQLGESLPWPKWLRISRAVSYSGLCRSTLYALMSLNKIKSHSVKNARIVCRESLDEYIGSQPSRTLTKACNDHAPLAMSSAMEQTETLGASL